MILDTLLHIYLMASIYWFIIITLRFIDLTREHEPLRKILHSSFFFWVVTVFTILNAALLWPIGIIIHYVFKKDLVRVVEEGSKTWK